MEGTAERSLPSDKPLEIDLLVVTEGGRNSVVLGGRPANSVRANNRARDCCSISDDESSPADDDCILTLDQTVDSNHKMSSDCIEVDITAQDSTTDDDMQAEVSDLGIKIHDVCSLSSPSDKHAADILELIEVTSPAIESRPIPGTPCAKKSSDRSVTQFFEQEFSRTIETKGGKCPDWHRNGENSKWQPVVPLVDVMRKPPLETVALRKAGNLPGNEEEDCVVIENDAKTTQDVIVLDDLLDSNASNAASSSATVNNGRRLNCCPLSPNAKSSLKRPSSPQSEDGLCRKVPRTESADELLILDSPALNSTDGSSIELPDLVDSEDSPNEDVNLTVIHIVPDALDVNGDCAQVSQSSCVPSVSNRRGEEDRRRSSPHLSLVMTCGTTDDDQGNQVSASSSSKVPRGFSQKKVAASPAPLPSSGDARDVDKEKLDAVSSSEIEVSSSVRLPNLVSYDLSDSNDSESSSANLTVSSTSHDVTIISHDCDSTITSMASTSPTLADEVVTPLESTSCSTSEAMSTKTFYGSSASREDVFPKQYSTRRGQHKSKQKVDANQSVIEDVVHISSDEEDPPRRRRDECASTGKNYGKSRNKEKSNALPLPEEYEVPAVSCPTPKKGGRRKTVDDCNDLQLIRPKKIVYRSKTCIPRDCLLTPEELFISVKKGSFSFDVSRFVLDKVTDGRIVFRIPSDAALDLNDMLALPPEFNLEITSMNSRLTLCMDESTPMSTLLSLLDQIRVSETPADDMSTSPESDSAKLALRPSNLIQNIVRTVRKHVPKKLASWARPRHWNKPFFQRYGEPRTRIHLRGCTSSSDEYNPAGDDAFVQMEPFEPYYEMPEQPIQVSGFAGTVIKLFTYPPPPIARGIAVTNEDLFCLNVGEYVNDVIIDFYLKYLFNEMLSSEDRARTHIFSSFFYGHLISVTGSSTDPPSNLSLPEQRHQKVRTWTRQVDIFSKDFIIVPINENYHWFLAIICFPGLSPQTKATKTDPSKATEDAHKTKSSSSDTSVTSDESNAELKSNSESKSEESESKEVVKNACILIFDSLQGDIRWDVSRTLREYLQVEWDKKKSAAEGRRSFDKDFMKGCRPQCPQQPNYSDCGLYLLQYVEAFFKKPLKNFTLPIRYLLKWFDGSEARAKRSQLRTLILELKDQLNPDLEYDAIADGCCNDVAVNDYETI